MLIVSRRVGERICIGEGVEVVVTEVTRKGVRLGIKAPIETIILRGEVRDSIEQANRAAASSTLAVEAPSAETAGEARTPAVLAVLNPNR
jgi:carbon storage regulator